MTAGYSDTPLAKKLGIPSNKEILLINQPTGYLDWFSDWPEQVQVLEAPNNSTLPFIQIFCLTKDDLQNAKPYIKHLKKDGMLWISWPKGKSNIISELNGNIVREFFLEAGLVDVKVAAINEDWSGLKFIYRINDR